MSALMQVMACYKSDYRTVPDHSSMHICVSRPQWISKGCRFSHNSVWTSCFKICVRWIKTLQMISAQTWILNIAHKAYIKLRLYSAGIETARFTTKFLHTQYHGCCFDAYPRSQRISIYGINLVCQGYSGFRPNRVEYFRVHSRLEFTLIVAFRRNQGLVSKSDKTSYLEISWSLATARLVVWIIVSLSNATGTSAALLPKCMSYCRAITQF